MSECCIESMLALINLIPKCIATAPLTSSGCFMKGTAVAPSPANMSSICSVVMERDM